MSCHARSRSSPNQVVQDTTAGGGEGRQRIHRVGSNGGGGGVNVSSLSQFIKYSLTPRYVCHVMLRFRWDFTRRMYVQPSRKVSGFSSTLAGWFFPQTDPDIPPHREGRTTYTLLQSPYRLVEDSLSCNISTSPSSLSSRGRLRHGVMLQTSKNRGSCFR